MLSSEVTCGKHMWWCTKRWEYPEQRGVLLSRVAHLPQCAQGSALPPIGSHGKRRSRIYHQSSGPATMASLQCAADETALAIAASVHLALPDGWL